MNQQKKFALGGGSYSLYAPRFPRYQYLPGFADEVLIYEAVLPSLYSLAVVENGVAMNLECSGMKKKDGAAVLTYDTGAGLKVTETRFVSADDRFVSKIDLQNVTKAERELFIVLWTTTDPEGEPVSLEGDSVRVRRSLQREGSPPLPVEILWSSPGSRGAKCLQAFFAEGGSNRPDYEETPWAGLLSFPTPRAKRPMQKPSPILPSARVYLGLFRPVTLKGNGKASHRFEARAILKGKDLNYRPRRPDAQDENGYQAFFAKAPKFTCEWKPLERIVQHRLEALHMLRVPHGAGNMTAANVCAGNGMSHIPISFAAPAIMRDVRWLRDPMVSRGIIRGFFENIRQNGMVPGRLHLTALQNAGFFHADWGGGFEALDASHPDRATKRAVLMPMQRYVKWLANNRDPEGSGLTDVVNHFESGQELSRRYTIIDDKADRAEDESEQFRLKAVDASIFRYRMIKFLIKVADEMQEKAMANRFIAEAEVIHDVMRKKMWDEKSGLFMDIDPKSRRRTGVKAAVGFYPLCTDIPTPAMVEKMLSTLGSRKEFWAKYPVPSLSIDDPYYNPDGYWKGTRRESPWNGRVWPIINSHVLEGLAYVAERGNKKAQRLTGELFKRTVTMMSGELEGLEEARSFEHYNPDTGSPSRFRGVDFHMQSFILDNVFRVGCGLAVRFGDLKNDPVMGDMPDFKLHGVPVGNKVFNAERKNGKLKIVLD